ncbi:MAG: hypothetical protein R6V19_12595 [Armatimonadota bacterium]
MESPASATSRKPSPTSSKGNASVEAVIAMVDRLAGAREAIQEAGYTFYSIFTVEDLGVKVE